jgi:hypothetical protein
MADNSIPNATQQAAENALRQMNQTSDTSGKVASPEAVRQAAQNPPAAPSNTAVVLPEALKQTGRK